MSAFALLKGAKKLFNNIKADVENRREIDDMIARMPRPRKFVAPDESPRP